MSSDPKKHAVRAVLIACHRKSIIDDKTTYEPYCLVIFDQKQEGKWLMPGAEGERRRVRSIPLPNVSSIYQTVDGKDVEVSVQIHPGMNDNQFRIFQESVESIDPKKPGDSDIKKEGIVANSITDAPDVDVVGWIALFKEWTERLKLAAKQVVGEVEK